MASDQHTCPTTHPHRRVGVKRTRTPEYEPPRKSARLEQKRHCRPTYAYSSTSGNRPILADTVIDGVEVRLSTNRYSRKQKCTPQQQRPADQKPSGEHGDWPRGRQRESSDESNGANEAQSHVNQDEHCPIAYWIKHQEWPQQMKVSSDGMENILARKRSFSSMRKQSDTVSATTNPANLGESRSRELKSAEYRQPQYVTILATNGVFMHDSKLDLSPESRLQCRRLLEGEGDTPEHSLFHDDVFVVTCQKLQDKNEARVAQDVTRLIVPSAESLHTFGAAELWLLTESVNEGWNNSIPITKTRPQPDYAVGFRREAFKQAQLDRMHPIVGDFNDQSYFMATWFMYFPFLTCEVKCGASALDIADRQNAHSGAIAVRAVVELFRAVNREKELDREILAFSISHDHAMVRIYAHYAEIGATATETNYCRHTIRKFDFTELDGREKWTTYKFTRSVYEKWMPKHFERICSAIDQIPLGISFSVSHTEPSSLSQDSTVHSIAQSSAAPASEHVQDHTQASKPPNTATTPNTSVHEDATRRKPRREHHRGVQR